MRKPVVTVGFYSNFLMCVARKNCCIPGVFIFVQRRQVLYPVSATEKALATLIKMLSSLFLNSLFLSS